jgi:carboxyl-terminal processing protease
VFLALLTWLAAAAEPVPVERYSHALHLVNKLYLYPDRLDERRLLGYAARGLSDDLPWLMADRDDATVSLSHGNGTPLGQVTVTSMHTLPQALADLEQLVRDSPWSIGDTDMRLSLLDGMRWGLDSYTQVLSGDRLARFKVRLKGVTVGVGATITRTDQALVVTSLALDGPAAGGGLKRGDVILRIDGRSTVNMPSSEAGALLRGTDGTQVSVRVLRDTTEREYVLTRAQVVVPNVEHRVLEGQVGYVRITHVSQQTSANLSTALESLRAEGALEHGLVLDLRGNTGGSMKEAARSADAFLEDGLLLRTVGPDGGRVPNLQARMEAQTTDDEPAVPIVIVVDDRTASGSEIIAGALMELERAALVGTRTYGKGTVQKTYTLDDNAQLKLTVAQYLLANDRVIADRGIVPDVVLGAVQLKATGMRLSG